MSDLIVSVLDRCLSFYFVGRKRHTEFNLVSCKKPRCYAYARRGKVTRFKQPIKLFHCDFIS